MLLRNVLLLCKSQLRSFSCDLVTKMGRMPRIVELSKAATGQGWDELVQDACASIGAENIIAVPTDTIYGIAGMAQSDKAIASIYSIKDRDPNKPISICVGDVEDIYNWSHVTVPRSLLSALLPGPVTVVFKRRPELNPHLNPGTELVGLRVPDYGFVRDLVRTCGQPLALTSANRSSEPSTVAVQEFECLWPLLELIVDGGRIGGGASQEERLGSTVVNLAEEGHYSIIRQGSAFRDTVHLLKKHGLKEFNR